MSVSILTNDSIPGLVLHSLEDRSVKFTVCDVDNVALYSLPQELPASQSVLEVSPLGVASFVAVSALGAAGNTSSRPVSPVVGQQYFDTTVGYPIWWNGAAWVNASGTPV